MAQRGHERFVSRFEVRGPSLKFVSLFQATRRKNVTKNGAQALLRPTKVSFLCERCATLKHILPSPIIWPRYLRRYERS